MKNRPRPKVLKLPGTGYHRVLRQKTDVPATPVSKPWEKYVNFKLKPIVSYHRLRLRRMNAKVLPCRTVLHKKKRLRTPHVWFMLICSRRGGSIAAVLAFDTACCGQLIVEQEEDGGSCDKVLVRLCSGDGKIYYNRRLEYDFLFLCLASFFFPSLSPPLFGYVSLCFNNTLSVQQSSAPRQQVRMYSLCHLYSAQSRNSFRIFVSHRVRIQFSGRGECAADRKKTETKNRPKNTPTSVRITYIGAFFGLGVSGKMFIPTQVVGYKPCTYDRRQS